MQYWECCFVSIANANIEEVEAEVQKQINALGRQGWRMVPITIPGPGGAGGLGGIWMEREVSSEKKE